MEGIGPLRAFGTADRHHQTEVSCNNMLKYERVYSQPGKLNSKKIEFAHRERTQKYCKCGLFCVRAGDDQGNAGVNVKLRGLGCSGDISPESSVLYLPVYKTCNYFIS